MSSADLISQFIETFSDNTLPFVTAMAAIGVLTMAIIQTAKDIFPLRNAFQRRYLADWLRNKAAEAAAAGAKRPDPAKAEKDLIRLATAGDDKAFYDLPVEQLCGQMNAAAQVVLDYPADHPDVLRCLAALAEPSDVELLTQPVRKGVAATRTQEQVDARTRIIHQVQRAIDGFQISAGFRWKFWLQVASFILSFLLTIAGLSLHAEGAATLKNGLIVLITGVVGGFLAPVARDLVASLQKLRG